MRKSIRVKNNATTRKLFENPMLVALMVKIGMEQDDELGGVHVEDLRDFGRGDIFELEEKGLIVYDVENGVVGLKDKRVVDITLKKTTKAQTNVNHKLLHEVKEHEVPKEQLMYYKIAKGYQDLFGYNMTQLGAKWNSLYKAGYKKWVDTVRLMIEVDNVTEQEFREVWAFLKGHKFWAENVRSIPKLREKFETIYSQYKGDERRKQQQTNQSGTNTPIEYAKEVFNRLQSD